MTVEASLSFPLPEPPLPEAFTVADEAEDEEEDGVEFEPEVEAPDETPEVLDEPEVEFTVEDAGDLALPVVEDCATVDEETFLGWFPEVEEPEEDAEEREERSILDMGSSSGPEVCDGEPEVLLDLSAEGAISDADAVAEAIDLH